MEEIWKDIEGFEGYYQVSNLGRIKSFDRYLNCKAGGIRFHKGTILSDCNNGYGYRYVR